MEEVIVYKADDGTIFTTAEEAGKRDRRNQRKTEEKLADRANQLTSNLRHEFSDGVHTRSMCGCDNRAARGSKCFMCLIEEFIDESY